MALPQEHIPIMEGDLARAREAPTVSASTGTNLQGDPGLRTDIRQPVRADIRTDYCVQDQYHQYQ